MAALQLYLRPLGHWCR